MRDKQGKKKKNKKKKKKAREEKGGICRVKKETMFRTINIFFLAFRYWKKE
jgi:hypothetical protein